MYRYTIQYADPSGPFPLAHDAAWQTYCTTHHAEEALEEIEGASHRQHGVNPPYAVRILDGDDVIVTDVPGSVLDPDDVADLRDVTDKAHGLIRRAELEDNKLIGELADVLAALIDLTVVTR